MGHYGSCVHSNPDKQVFVQCPEHRDFDTVSNRFWLLLWCRLAVTTWLAKLNLKY